MHDVKWKEMKTERMTEMVGGKVDTNSISREETTQMSNAII